MFEGITAPVLRCAQCNKPFDKESTLKRHGYYCRSRQSARTTRTRSCIACAKAKARCDNERLGCSRCLSKGVDCKYPAIKSRSPTSDTQRHDVDPAQQHDVDPLLATSQFGVGPPFEAPKSTDVTIDPTLHIFDPDFADLVQYFNPAQELGNLWNLPMMENGVQYQSSEPSSLSYASTPSEVEVVRQDREINPSNTLARPMSSTHLRAFDKRSRLTPSTQRTAKLICHTLQSYPLMMLRDKALPPFIHPQSLSIGGEGSDTELLANCVSLVYMLGSNVQGNQKLFWRNVRMECERICAYHQQMSPMELLAAMQALSVYILIRLREGETEDKNLDSLLVRTVSLTAIRFNSLGTSTEPQVQPVQKGVSANWLTWIYEESAKRLCVIYQVVNMLVYFEPAALCGLHGLDLLLAPLPSRKQLWEAGDEAVWKAESDRITEHADMAFGLATNGNLISFDESWFQNGIVSIPEVGGGSWPIASKGNVEWEEWCSGMDGLGNLVMLAATLVV